MLRRFLLAMLLIVMTIVLVCISGTLSNIEMHRMDTPAYVLADEPIQATATTKAQTSEVETKIEQIIFHYNPDITTEQSRLFSHAIWQTSQEHEVDWLWITAIVWQECSFNLYPKTRTYVGPMQVHPNVGRCYGATLEELYDPHTNIDVGVAYLSDLIKAHYGDYRKATLAYNSGSESVRRGIANIGYYRSVVENYNKMKQFVGEE